jgi:hypothetical protein
MQRKTIVSILSLEPSPVSSPPQNPGVAFRLTQKSHHAETLIAVGFTAEVPVLSWHGIYYF